MLRKLDEAFNKQFQEAFVMWCQADLLLVLLLNLGVNVCTLPMGSKNSPPPPPPNTFLH